MAWVRLDDGYFRHPKAIAAGPLARELNFAAWCWSAANLTDGHIPKHVVPLIAAEAGVRANNAARLVDVGLWDDNGSDYEIHDYLERNPSREHVEHERARWRRYKQGSTAESTADSTAETSRNPPRIPPPFQRDSTVPSALSRPVPSRSGLHTQSSSKVVRAGTDDDDDKRLRIQAFSALNRRYRERPDLPAIGDVEAWVATHVARIRAGDLTELTDVEQNHPTALPFCGQCHNGNLVDDDGEYVGRCPCRQPAP